MTIWIVPIEPIDQRYTKQWYDNIPKLLKPYLKKGEKIVTLDGHVEETGTTSGAFLDFGKTNEYKATQVVEISQLFSAGKIKAGDKFLVTDAWNFAITPIKYMSDLLDIPVEIHGIWHAGAYDPSDILGLKMQKPWPHHVERSWYYASDYNYFGTHFHKNMFLENLKIPLYDHDKAHQSGQPHDYLKEEILSIPKPKYRDNILVWPHRYNEDKQPDIIEDIKKRIPEVEVIITQKHNFSKREYYELLCRSKMIFSCALHENLGISMMEAVLAGCIPLMPKRASYQEMYDKEFLYPSRWTESYSAYRFNKDEVANKIRTMMADYKNYEESIQAQQERLNKYLTADIMFSKIAERKPNGSK